jgi:hypothetical protein
LLGIKEKFSPVQKHLNFNAVSVLKKVNLNLWQTCHDLLFGWDVTGTGSGLLGGIPRVVVQISALTLKGPL